MSKVRVSGQEELPFEKNFLKNSKYSGENKVVIKSARKSFWEYDEGPEPSASFCTTCSEGGQRESLSLSANIPIHDICK